MKCKACGPDKEYDILFNCPDCNQSYCSEHVNNHPHAQQASPENISFGRFTIDLSQFGQFARQQARREPTQEEYEMFLRQNPRVLTTGRESLDLFLGIMLIAWVFGFRPLLDGNETWQFIIVLTMIISPAFILHELAHKYMAIHYGKYARFTLIRTMAYFTFLAGLIGIPIAGPGATMILGNSSESENGIFASAGPATNFVLSGISLLIYQLVPSGLYLASVGQELGTIFLLSAFINGILGVFNLIPIGSLDGRKILNWNSLVWILLVLINIPSIYLSYEVVFAL